MPNAAHKPLYSIKAQKTQRDLKCCVCARVVGAKRKIENKLAAKVGIDRLRNTEYCRRPCQRVYSYSVRNLLSRRLNMHLWLQADRPADTTLFTQLAQHVICIMSSREGKARRLLGVIELRLQLTAAQQNNVMWSCANPSLYNLSASCSQSQAPSTAAAAVAASTVAVAVIT